MWQRLKTMVLERFGRLRRPSQEPPTRWERAQEALRRAQEGRAKRDQVRPG